MEIILNHSEFLLLQEIRRRHPKGENIGWTKPELRIAFLLEDCGLIYVFRLQNEKYPLALTALGEQVLRNHEPWCESFTDAFGHVYMNTRNQIYTGYEIELQT